jgi:hypothetical protein
MPEPHRRSVPRLLENMAKKGDWHSLALVGVSEPELAIHLVQAARRARLTVIASWPEEGALRAAKLAGNQRQLRKLARANGDRLTFLEATPKEALKAVGDDTFDAVALMGVTGKELGSAGKKWAEHVNDGGTLLGIDHRDPDTAKALKKLAPDHQRLRDGLWAARVRRPSAEGEEQGEPDPVLSEPPAIEGPELEDPPIEETEPDLEEDPPSDGERDLALEAAEPEPEPAPPVVKRTRGRPRKAP